jgi:hypothetical protein
VACEVCSGPACEARSSSIRAMFFAVKLCQKGGGVGKRDARALACGCSVIVSYFAKSSIAWPQESEPCSSKVVFQMVMLCRIEAAPSRSRIVVEAATLM